ncbi:smp-30 gluconolaconase lre-like region [Colletotrichum karsti]|uniref:Smp-30 gluconolaconase lre-like region n=1 Tax=Colletotrichum karsti TaxID=1095194 RepID=A0A9P6HY19_9PEZI|nr:smp-30 gluconolaconase lre-like region [Colletotrichum karsti]KAF9872182.1 smp-30 gluconolaconase lre-like region [Colletotrichum karsti]
MALLRENHHVKIAVTLLTAWASLIQAAQKTTVEFKSYQPSFQKLIGQKVSGRLATELPWEAFHEGGIYNKDDNSLYIASNFDTVDNPINITILSLDDLSIRSQRYTNLSMPNGGTTFRPVDASSKSSQTLQVWCDQGDFTNYSKLVTIDTSTNETKTLLSSFINRNFTSINDVRQHPKTGDLWFTDAYYAHFNGFRPEPQLPTQVYRYNIATGSVQVVADGLQQPNGIEFSPDFKTVYISDTGAATTSFDPKGPATIYAYDVVDDKRRLSNKRVFAYTDNGIPDGLHTDVEGNLWASCGDGVHVWNSRGDLLGKVFTGDYTSNFAFAPGRMFIFSNSRLWVVENVEGLIEAATEGHFGEQTQVFRVRDCIKNLKNKQNPAERTLEEEYQSWFNTMAAFTKVPLHDAGENGDARVIHIVLKAVNVNPKDVQARTALHICCSKGNVDFIQDILTTGASLNVSLRRRIFAS